MVLGNRSLLRQLIELLEQLRVLITVEVLKHQMTELVPFLNASPSFHRLQPGSRGPLEIERREPCLQRLMDAIHLEIHETLVPPKPGVITIEFREFKLQKRRGMGRITRIVAMGMKLSASRHTRDRAWWGSEDPTAQHPMILRRPVPTGPVDVHLGSVR